MFAIRHKRTTSEVETLKPEQLSSRLRERLCEPAMPDLTKRLIAIPSESPPGNHYEECTRTLLDELDRLGFDDVRREDACVLASVGTGRFSAWVRPVTAVDVACVMVVMVKGADGPTLAETF